MKKSKTRGQTTFSVTWPVEHVAYTLQWVVMPRRARMILRDFRLHTIQRGNNRQACFQGDDDDLFYRDSWKRLRRRLAA